MTGRVVEVVHLYPRDMNIYGDLGNTLTIRRRLERYGYEPRVRTYDPGDPFPADADLVIGGGGQDSGQDRVHDDLLARGDDLRALAADGVPMLMVCGLYQLFGHVFRTRAGRELTGIGVLDVETIGKDERLIGNIVTESEDFGRIVGFENHSGQTFLGPGARPFGTVVSGAGNNTDDTGEGARTANVIGTYLHGSLLPKNPAVADFLIRTAVERRHGRFEPTGAPDDTLAQNARRSAMSRPR